MTQDLPCVYRAVDVGEADIVAAWLEEQGIAAFVKDSAAVGLYGPLAISPLGVKVCVANAEEAGRAEALLREHAAVIEARKAGTGESPVEVVCEACGTATTFPSQQRGSVQSCPKCRAFVDVPGNTEPELDSSPRSE